VIGGGGLAEDTEHAAFLAVGVAFEIRPGKSSDRKLRQLRADRRVLHRVHRLSIGPKDLPAGLDQLLRLSRAGLL